MQTDNICKPNLFKFATSELTQDAIICWLLEWAKPAYQNTDRQMHRIGVVFLNSLFEKFDDITTPKTYNSLKIKKQYKHIDVLCIVNDTYVIIIEDKTNSKNHSMQLERYYKNIKKVYDDHIILPIYFKTSDQGNYDGVVSQGYKIYLRKDFLSVMNGSFNSEILKDYKIYLQDIEDRVNSYKYKSVDIWSSDAIKGFYMRLQKVLGEGNWDYVPNARGGFWGFWWNSYQLDGYRIYIQLDYTEPSKIELKFKLASGTKEKVSKHIIALWRKHILYSDDTCEIVNPRVIRAGRWTTIGILKNELIAMRKDRKINFSETVANIKIIENIFKVKIKTLKDLE